MRSLVFLFIILVPFCTAAPAGEPFFKAGDVIAFVGGEDMVVAAELGYLETLIQLALPEHRLKFRSLAREGDTVFEQRRDLNYPNLETQLDTIGATVVICQFGQMESLAAARAMDGMDKMDAVDKMDAPKGESAVHEVHKVQAIHEKADATRKAKVAEFVAAYEKLIGRLKGKDGKRKVAIAEANYYYASWDEEGEKDANKRQTTGELYSETFDLAQKTGSLRLESTLSIYLPRDTRTLNGKGHTNEESHKISATAFAAGMLESMIPNDSLNLAAVVPLLNPKLTTLVAAKNRLWFHYYRPQNWAFLAGDRTNQPSSRDHLDPSKRWFPDELAKFLPLVEAKDAEIWALAKKLSAEGGK